MNIKTDRKEFRKKVLKKVLVRFLIGILILGLLIFVPAGTLKFFNGWLFLCAFLVPMILALVYLLFRDPELLEKRVSMNEKEQVQKIYVKYSLILFIASYIIPGLDFRFGWSAIPSWLVLISLLFMIAGYLMFVAVMLQNRYASRIIEIQHEQRIIDTGLYSVIRHPMYLAASILFLSSSLVLGSFYALIPMLSLPFLLAFRIKNEEKVLLKGLPGYKEYTKKVKYRLIPFIW